MSENIKIIISINALKRSSNFHYFINFSFSYFDVNNADVMLFFEHFPLILFLIDMAWYQVKQSVKSCCEEFGFLIYSDYIPQLMLFNIVFKRFNNILEHLLILSNYYLFW